MNFQQQLEDMEAAIGGAPNVFDNYDNSSRNPLTEIGLINEYINQHIMPEEMV